MSSLMASLVESESNAKGLSTIPVVAKIPNVFSHKLLGTPFEQAMEFTIDLAPWTTLVSRALYHMALEELKELKNQLEKEL